MKEWLAWFKENILMSRTALFAFLVLIIGTVLWIIFVPKTLEAWIAIGGFATLIYGWLAAINKKGDDTAAKIEIAKIEADK